MILVVVLISLPWRPTVCVSAAFTPTTASTKILVCQNKDCCQRWKLHTPLPDVLHDLLGPMIVDIETTSCLSLCGKGPNVSLVQRSGGVGQEEQVYLNGLVDAVSVAAALDALSFTVPTKLLAAVNVFEKAQSGEFVTNVLSSWGEFCSRESRLGV